MHAGQPFFAPLWKAWIETRLVSLCVRLLSVNYFIGIEMAMNPKKHMYTREVQMSDRELSAGITVYIYMCALLLCMCPNHP